MIRSAIVLALAGSVALLSAQAPGPSQSTTTFDVSSIKVNTTTRIPLSDGHLAFLRVAGAGNAKNGGFSMTGDIAATPLTVLIELAHNVKALQLLEPLKICGGFRRQSTPEGQVLEAVGISMTTMAKILSDAVGRVVVDKTGFTQLFSFRLQFANRATDSGPSMFAALEEQLGVRLRSVTGPVEALVIESVERPRPN